MTGSTLFSGGEGVGVGMRAAGLTHAWGIEYDDAVAEVARLNGFHAITADVRGMDYEKLPRPDVVHASPVCVNASQAKQDGKESAVDVELADAVCEALRVLLPRMFTLENVWGYRKFAAFGKILESLTNNGYRFEYWHLNAADYGVPQTRKRLILVARRDGAAIVNPQPTHTDAPVMLFETLEPLEPWVGWYAAIEDLIALLPPARLAEWQLERLPSKLGNLRGLLVDSAGFPDNAGVRVAVTRAANKPTNTVVANYARRAMRAVLLENQQSDDGRGGTYGVTARMENECALTTTRLIGNAPKMFLMQMQDAGGDGVRDLDEPMQTVTRAHGAGKYRAFVTDARNGHAGKGVMASNDSGRYRAWLENGRVIKMTARALARFQSFPDTYALPRALKTRNLNEMETVWFERLERGNLDAQAERFLEEWLWAADKVAMTVIGNAVPPLLYQRVLEAQLQP